MARTSSPAQRRTLREEHTEATRAALIDSARALFGRRGYASVSLDEIAATARVTKGALYHHFGSKKELFRGVCEDIEGELSEQALASGLREMDLLAGVFAFLDAFADPVVQQIVARDAPSVFSWEEHRAIQSEHALGAIATGLEAAMRRGQIAKQPIDPLANLFLAVLCEGASVVANADDPKAARNRVRAALRRLVGGLSA